MDGLTTVAEFNLGGTNQAKTLQWHTLAECMAGEEVGLLALTEASNKAKTGRLARNLGRQVVNGPDDADGRYALIMDKIGYDYAALLYDTRRYRCPEDGKYYVSRASKYLWCELEDVEDGRRVDVAVMHLPYKKTVKTRQAMLREALGTATAPETLVLGDFNLSPDPLCDAFGRLSLAGAAAAPSDEQVAFADARTAPVTTKKGHTYDNMLTVPLYDGRRHKTKQRRYVDSSSSALLPFATPGTFDSMLGSDHYPVIAEWRFSSSSS